MMIVKTSLHCILNKTPDQITERCQHFDNRQPWDQLSLCIFCCTWEFENLFERCKEWAESGKIC